MTRPKTWINSIGTSADDATLHRESTVLGVREPQTSIAELLAQHVVILLEVRDDLGLVAVHPAREHQE